MDHTGGAGQGLRTGVEAPGGQPQDTPLSTDTLVAVAVVAAFAIGGLMVLFAPRAR